MAIAHLQRLTNTFPAVLVGTLPALKVLITTTVRASENRSGDGSRGTQRKNSIFTHKSVKSAKSVALGSLKRDSHNPRSVTGSNTDATESQEEILVQRDVVCSSLLYDSKHLLMIYATDRFLHPSPSSVPHPLPPEIPGAVDATAQSRLGEALAVRFLLGHPRFNQQYNFVCLMIVYLPRFATT